MRCLLSVLVGVAAIAAPTLSQACDRESGAREQTVDLSWGSERVKTWSATSSEIEPVTLPNGFELGVRVEPATTEKYNEALANSAHVSELVRIRLFDLNGRDPVLLTHAWGGANSLQGFGARGGADRLEQLGDPGVLLTLLNPVCAASRAVAHAY